MNTPHATETRLRRAGVGAPCTPNMLPNPQKWGLGPEAPAAGGQKTAAGGQKTAAEGKRAATGFTLAELLVALALFGLIAAASVAMLSMGVTTREVTQARLDQQGQLLRMRALLLADLGQAVPRRWRDASGRPQPAFAMDQPSGLMFRAVRAGWANPDGAARASLQRVEWRLDNGRLERRSAALLDGAAFGPPAVLLAGVEAVQVRVHTGGQWQDRWPPLGQAIAPGALPDALELTVQSRETGTLTQIIRLAPGQLS